MGNTTYPPIEGIRNIIFDLGRVIINLNEAATDEAFTNLALSAGKDIRGLRPDDEFFHQFERGEVSDDEFVKKFQAILPELELSEDAIKAAWNAMLLDIPEKKLHLLEELKEKYNTYILSNTNGIHIDFVNDYMQSTFLEDNLDPYFHQVYLSHEIGARKPELRAWEIILEEHDLNPFETLFIDDKLENIEAAKKLGLVTCHLLDAEDLYGLFS